MSPPFDVRYLEGVLEGGFPPYPELPKVINSGIYRILEAPAWFKAFTSIKDFWKLWVEAWSYNPKRHA